MDVSPYRFHPGPVLLIWQTENYPLKSPAGAACFLRNPPLACDEYADFGGKCADFNWFCDRDLHLQDLLAERQGFEPWVQLLTAQWFSNFPSLTCRNAGNRLQRA